MYFLLLFVTNKNNLNEKLFYVACYFKRMTNINKLKKNNNNNHNNRLAF